MATTITDINELAKAQYEQYRAIRNARKWLVAVPLYFSTTFFKNLFSKVIGLDFLIYHWRSQGMTAATSTIILPSITYAIEQNDNKTVFEYIVGGRDSREGLGDIVSGFSVVKSGFIIPTYFALPVVIWNYFIRNAGKMLGCCLAAIWSVPVHCMMKTVESMVCAFNDVRLTHQLRSFDKQTLMESYMKGELSNVSVLILNKFFTVAEFETIKKTGNRDFRKDLKGAAQYEFSCSSYFSFCALGTVLGAGVATLILFGMHDFSLEETTPESNIATKASVFFGGCALLSAALSYGYKRREEMNVTAQLVSKV